MKKANKGGKAKKKAKAIEPKSQKNPFKTKLDKNTPV